MPEQEKVDNVDITEIAEIRITLVGTPADSFARKVRKRMPTLARATDVAVDTLRHLIEKHAGKGAGMRFTVIGASKVLNADEKRALLADQEEGEK